MEELRKLILKELIIEGKDMCRVDREHEDWFTMLREAKHFQSLGVNAAIPWDRESICFSLEPFEQCSRWENSKEEYYDQIFNTSEKKSRKLFREDLTNEENKYVKLYYYKVTVGLNNEISIEKNTFNAVLNRHNYDLYDDNYNKIGFTPKNYLDHMRKSQYYFYSLKGDYTNDEIFDKFTPFIEEELEYHKNIVKDLEKQLYNCRYYTDEN